MTVVDASAVLEVLLQSAFAPSIESRLFRAGESLHAPHLIDVEIAQALRKYALRGQVTDLRGRQALADLADFPLARYPHDLLLPRLWDLRGNLNAYDAVYVALAEELQAPLVTRDARIAAAPGHRARVEVV